MIDPTLEAKGVVMGKPKVVLFFPNTGFDIKGVSVDLPLAVLNLAAFITDDCDVAIIDQRVEADWRRRLTRELETQPLCLGVSSMTCPQILYGLEACLMAREITPRTVRVWGGVHPTLMPKSTLQNALVDIVVRDQGEMPFKMLLNALTENRDADLSQIPSLSYVDNDGVYQETPLLKEPRGRLNLYPPLPYDLLAAGVETYVGSQGRFADPDTRSLIAITSVGCPERCTYCAMPGMDSTRTQIAETPEFTVARIKDLVTRYRLNAIAFHDEEFAINPKRAIAIAELLIKEIGGRKSGFRWWCQTRMDTIERLSNFKGVNYLPLLIESGLESFQPGIESGSDRILGMIKKRETTDLFIRVNRLLAQYAELHPLYNFMVGFPTETIEEMQATMRLAVQLIDENPYAMIAGVYVLVPYPGTEIYDIATAAGFQPPSTLEEWAEFNRQQLLTPWVARNPEVLGIAEFTRLTSRFVDGKRLPRRLDHALGGMTGLSETSFEGLSALVKERWRSGNFSQVEVFRAFNEMVLALFNVGKTLKLGKQELGGMGSGVDERGKELLVDTALRLGGDEIKQRDTEYHTAQQFLSKFGSLPQRPIKGIATKIGLQEASVLKFHPALN
jgi:anaerobic magnesium-protoporphyrin IX monomethyl ester cyclase